MMILLSLSCLLAAVPAYSLTASEKQTVVDLHNQFRSAVNPAASDMVKMYYDTELEAKIESWINTCPDNHDSGGARNIAGWGMKIGQNLAWGYSDWTAAITGWHAEVQNFSMGVGSINGGSVGHYTQVVFNQAARVGCAFKNCPGTEYGTYHGCDYAHGQGGYETPYTTGSSCSACSGKCSNKLCDCGGKICKNGGELSLTTCACTCLGSYSGSDCGKIDCPAQDPSQCGKEQPYGFPASFCTKWTNVPLLCPRMCGKC